MKDGRWKTARRAKVPFSIFRPRSALRPFFMASIRSGVIIHGLKCQETHKTSMDEKWQVTSDVKNNSVRGLQSCHMSRVTRRALHWMLDVARFPVAFLIAGFIGLSAHAADFSLRSTNAPSRVVIVENPNAVSDFQPDAGIVQDMVNRGLTSLTGKAEVTGAWRSLVSTQDVVGIKVCAEPGEISGTRPAVVAAVIHGLLDAGVPPDNIIIWDKQTDDLRAAGFITAGRATRRARDRRGGGRLRPDEFLQPRHRHHRQARLGRLRIRQNQRGRRAQILCHKNRQPADHQNHQHRATTQRQCHRC